MPSHSENPHKAKHEVIAPCHIVHSIVLQFVSVDEMRNIQESLQELLTTWTIHQHPTNEDHKSTVVGHAESMRQLLVSLEEVEYYRNKNHE